MLRAPLAERMLAMEENTRPTLELERVQHYRFLESDICVDQLAGPAQHCPTCTMRADTGRARSLMCGAHLWDGLHCLQYALSPSQ